MPRGRLLAICSSVSWGGTEKWVLRACECLADRGWEVALAVRSPELFRARARGDLTLVALPLRNDGDLGSVLRLAASARRADVVLATRVRDYWLGGIAGRLAGVPVLLRLGVVRPMRDGYVMDRLRYGILPSAIVVNAARIREVLARTAWLRRIPIHLIYNGADAPGPPEASEHTALRRGFGIGDDETLLLGAGRLAMEKRWDWFVDAVADLEARGVRVCARLLGEGTEEAALRRRIGERGVGRRFRLEGQRTDVDAWLRAADVVVLPSRNEGISNFMLEALGHGLPLVATRSGGVDEVFTNGRHLLLAETEDRPGFAEALRRTVVDRQLRARLGEEGLAAVRARFTWEAMTDGLESLLTSVAERRPWSPESPEGT